MIEKVVVGIAIDERADVDHDQAFLAIGDEHAGVDRIDRLLFVFRQRARNGSMPSVLGSATLVAYFVRTYVRWPSGETGALTMRSEKPF